MANPNSIHMNVDTIAVDIETCEIDVSLSRAGPQGAKGDVGNTSIVDLNDVNVANQQEGDVLISDGTTFSNHQLTTTKLLDVDNTNRANGSVLVYNDTASKYEATSRLDNEDTEIVGGSF